MEKKCLKCKELKLLDCFSKDKSKKDGLQNRCKTCYFKYSKCLDNHFRKSFRDSVSRSKRIGREHTLTWEQWLTFKSKYSELHKKWVESRYKLKFCPSIDRIDNTKGYTFDNVQIITFEQNLSKENKGSKNIKAKLQPHDVIAIRALNLASPKLTQKKLGKMFNVSSTQIGRILKRKRWEHLPEPKLLNS